MKVNEWLKKLKPDSSEFWKNRIIDMRWVPQFVIETEVKTLDQAVELDEWLSQNIEGKYCPWILVIESYPFVLFEREIDAITFKLAWGRQT